MQYRFFFLIITLILIFGAGCSDNDSEGSSNESPTYLSYGNTDPCFGTTCDFVVIPSDGKLTDTPEDVEKTFIDLTEITVTVTDTNVSITMTMSNLPEQFTYNRLLGGGKEYSWSIWFDTDNSSKLSTGDLLLELNYNNFGEEAEETHGALLDFAEANLSEFLFADEMGYGSTVIGSHVGFITKAVTNNTITIAVEKSPNYKIEKVTPSTMVHFETYYNDGYNSFKDFFPNQ